MSRARRAFAIVLVAGTLAPLGLARVSGQTGAPARASQPAGGSPRAPAPAAAAPSATFPAGDGQLIAQRACLFCHSPMLVTQQAKDSSGWEKTIAQMAAWGAPLTPAEGDTLRGYLLGHFGPRAAQR